MRSSPSEGAYSGSARQEIHSILSSPKVHYCVHSSYYVLHAMPISLEFAPYCPQYVAKPFKATYFITVEISDATATVIPIFLNYMNIL
jgi:hypothetical protein